MPPTKQYMLNRALNELEAVMHNGDMQQGEVRHCIKIAMEEIRNVLHELDEQPTRVEVENVEKL